MKQLNLLQEKVLTTFGGSLVKGKRKSIRPLDSKKTLHLVLKADNSELLLWRSEEVEEIIRKYAHKYGIKIYGMAIHADHVHLIILIPNRILYSRWIRTAPAQLARKIKGLKWRFIPHTSVVNWGRHFKNELSYLKFNRQEAEFILKAHIEVRNWLNKMNNELSLRTS